MDRSTKYRLLGAGLLWLLAFLVIPPLVRDDDEAAAPADAAPVLALQGDGDLLDLPGPPMQERTLRHPEDFQDKPRRAEPAAAPGSGDGEAAPTEVVSPVPEPAPAAPPPAAAPAAAAEPSPGAGWAVQVGSFGDRENADVLAERLRGRGYPVLTTPFRSGEQVLYRVRVGPFTQRPKAESQLARVQQQLGLNGRVVAHP